MCYNKESSLILFLFSVAITIKLFLEDEQMIGAAVLSYGCVQLAEFFIWLGIDKGSININYYSSIFLAVVFLLQPIILALSSKFINKSDNPELERVNWSLLVLYVIVFSTFMIYRISKTSKKNIVSSVNKGSCRLAWNIFESSGPTQFTMLLYTIISIISIILGGEWSMLIIFFASILISLLYSYLVSRNIASIFGTIWCFSAVLMIMVYVIVKPEQDNN